MNSIQSNISFNNKYAKNVVELYLFYRLRMYASIRGGYIDGFQFSKTEKYDILPKIKKMGWIIDNKVCKYRNLLNNDSCATSTFNLTEYDLTSLDSFKAILIASCEKYLIDKKHKINEGKAYKYETTGFKKKINWDKMGMTDKKQFVQTKKIRLNDQDYVAGRAYNAELVRIMGLSNATITRWRKISNDMSKNEYHLRTIVLNSSLPNKLQYMSQRMNTNSKFVCKKTKSFATKDLIIASNIDVYTGKYKNLKYKKKS